MAEPEFSSSLRRFIRRYIDSVGTVEVLLLLHGEPEREWNAEEVSASLRSSTFSATRQLEDLARRGLFRSGDVGTYRYNPRTRQLGECVDELADAYARRRHPLIAFIYSEPDAADVISEGFTFRRHP